MPNICACYFLENCDSHVKQTQIYFTTHKVEHCAGDIEIQNDQYVTRRCDKFHVLFIEY